MTLLERSEQVGTITERFAQVDRAGHLVLISGEAGAGKSALVQQVIDNLVGVADVVVGRCDDLFAPRPLGPLVDIARGRPGPLADAIAAADQTAVFDAVLTELAAPPHPTVVVLEDLQWADEATLDLLRFVARRLDSVPCLILATHRDDLPSDHPIRRAVGTLVGAQVTRIHVPPLTVDAVRTLVGDRPIDPVSLHATTGGNPFFLIETIAVEPGTLSVTVRDVVLARAAPLSGAARDALDAAAVLGRHANLQWIQAVADCDADAIDECTYAGLLVDDGGVQAFRHDLSRQVVEEAMTPLRRRQLHSRALEALGEDGDIVHRAHHAIGAGDPAAVVDLAARAADACVVLGAWREAALLYGEAVEHCDASDPERRRFLEARATIGLRVELVEEAVAAGDELLAALEADGDQEKIAEWEAFLARAYRSVGRGREGGDMIYRAVARLEPLGDSPGLAHALAELSGHEVITGRYAQCIDTSRRAIALAEHFCLEVDAVYALDSLGSALGSNGQIGEGITALREAVDRAKRAGLHDAVTRSSGNLARTYLTEPQPALALEVLDEALHEAEEHELHFQLNWLRDSRAEVLGMLGDWDAASEELAVVLHDPWASPLNRVIVNSTLARIRVRRGDPIVVETLDELLASVLPFEQAQLIVPVYLARAEAAWLHGDGPAAAANVEACLEYVALLDVGHRRDVYLYARRTGVDWAPDDHSDEVIAHIASDDHGALARYWADRQCPYEAADALADSDDPDDVRRALEQLTALDARPRANQAIHRLRELGVRTVPRGPQASTRANPAGLTSRELEVATLLARGLTNAEIADQLIVSQKTIDHHVSSVLTKLEVSSRRHVVSAAAARGLDLHEVGSSTGAEPPGPSTAT